MSTEQLTQTDRSDAEQDRLAALHSYAILDTAPEEAFDRIVQLAHSLFGLPIALISLIDERRQWFKARLGVSVQETPRSWAFCNYAIQQTAPLVVPDASADPRFRNNPLVVGEPNIRFYAGAQIRDPDGHTLGTVCVISPTPNIAFTAQDEDRLTSLAGIVANEMELHRQVAAARRHAAEKDLLIREVNLQVANSLQMVADIVDLMSHEATDADAKIALHNAAGRIIAVGEVHQQLRRQGSAELANVHEYLGRLIRRLWRGVGPASHNETIDVAVAADMTLHIELLTRIGMAATALAMNAMRNGAVSLQVAVLPYVGWVVLTVGYEDNQPTPTGYDLDAFGTGVRLIRVLADGDNIARDPTDPRRIMVRFPA